MESFIKSEIFFFVSSVSVIIITFIILIAGIYFIKIMINLSRMSKKLKGVVDNTEQDLSEIGDRVKNSSIFNFIFGKKDSKNKK